MVGARLTRTDREIAGSGRVTDPATGTSRVVLVQRSTSDTDLLPNASARIEFGGGLQSRFNYSKTLSRPSFGQLNPGLSYVVSYVNTIQNSGSGGNPDLDRSEEHTSELQSLMRISYAVFCLKKKKK